MDYWSGEVTDELIELSKQYAKMFGYPPDEYEELSLEDITYEEFVALIKESLKQKEEIPDILGIY